MDRIPSPVAGQFSPAQAISVTEEPLLAGVPASVVMTQSKVLPPSEGAPLSPDTHVTSRTATPANVLSPPYVSRPPVAAGAILDLTHGSNGEEEIPLEYSEKSRIFGKHGKRNKSQNTATDKGAKKQATGELSELQIRCENMKSVIKRKDKQIELLKKHQTGLDQEIEELRQVVTGLSNKVKWLEGSEEELDGTVAGSTNSSTVKERELWDKLQKAQGDKKDIQDQIEALRRDYEADKTYWMAAVAALTKNEEAISESKRLLAEQCDKEQSRCSDLEQRLQESERSETHFRQLLLGMEAALSSDDAAQSMREGQSVEEDRKRLDWFVQNVCGLAEIRPEIRKLFDPTEEMSAGSETQAELGTTDINEQIEDSLVSATRDYGMDDSPDYQPSATSSEDESDRDSADEPDSEGEMAGDTPFRKPGAETSLEVTASLKSTGTQTEDRAADLAAATEKTVTPAIDIEPCLWTLEHLASRECFFGKPNPEEYELAGILAFLTSNPKDKKVRWSRLKESLQSYRIPVPPWPEFKQTNEWTEAMVRYAAFRLGKLSGDSLSINDFKDLKPDSAGYFFAFVQNIAAKTESNLDNFPDRLRKNQLPPPACGIFNAEPFEFSMAHINFLSWCSQAKKLSTIRLRSCTAVVPPSTLMYHGLTTEYALKIMDKYPPDQHSVTYDDETNRIITEKISNMNKDKAGVCTRMPVPDDVVDSEGVVVKKGLRRGMGVWTSDCFKILLEEGQLAVTLEAAKNKFEVFELIRRSAHLRELEAYKELLKQAMDYFPDHDLCSRVQGQKKITDKHTYKNLHPIEGTAVGDIPMDPAGFLLSCLYFHGFRHFKKEHVYNYVGRMLKLVDEGAVDKDENPNQDKRLKEIVDQLLVLKISAYSKDKGALDELKKIPVFRHWNLTIREIGSLRSTLPPVEWIDGQKTTGEYIETSRGAAIKLATGKTSGSKKRALDDRAEPSQAVKKTKVSKEKSTPGALFQFD